MAIMQGFRDSNDAQKFRIQDRVYAYSVKIINFIDTLPLDLSTRMIAKQLVRSATSIGANVIEAQAGCSRKDFTNFYSHALKSANETVYWLGLLKDAKKIQSPHLISLLDEAKELANILASCILTLKKADWNSYAHKSQK